MIDEADVESRLKQHNVSDKLTKSDLQNLRTLVGLLVLENEQLQKQVEQLYHDPAISKITHVRRWL